MFEAIIVITALFVVGLGLRKVFPTLCAICFAVFVGWILGFILRYDPLIVGMLMSASATGLMYYLSARLPERYSAFKLPFLLTAFSLIYFLLVQFDWQALAALFTIWLAFGLLSGEGLKKVVECCRNW